jgi:hypothetical protein
MYVPIDHLLVKIAFSDLVDTNPVVQIDAELPSEWALDIGSLIIKVPHDRLPKLLKVEAGQVARVIRHYLFTCRPSIDAAIFSDLSGHIVAVYDSHLFLPHSSLLRGILDHFSFLTLLLTSLELLIY